MHLYPDIKPSMNLNSAFIFCIIMRIEPYLGVSLKILPKADMAKYKESDNLTIDCTKSAVQKKVKSCGKYKFCKQAIGKKDGKEPWKCIENWKTVKTGDTYKGPAYDKYKYNVRMIGITTSSKKKISSNTCMFTSRNDSWYARFSIHPVIDALIIIFLCAGVIALIWVCCKSDQMRGSQMIENKGRPSTV